MTIQSMTMKIAAAAKAERNGQRSRDRRHRCDGHPEDIANALHAANLDCRRRVRTNFLRRPGSLRFERIGPRSRRQNP